MASFAEILAKKPKVETRQALMLLGLQNEFLAPNGHLPVDITSGFLDRVHSLILKFRELNGSIIWVQSLYEADRITSTSNTREGEGDALVIAGLVDGEETGSQAGDDESIKDQSASVTQPQSRSEKHKQRVLNLFKSRSSRRKALPAEEAKVIIEEDEELFLLKRARKGAACMPDSEGASFAKNIKDLMETPRDALIKTTNYSAFLGTNLLLTLRARLITEIYVCGCLSNVNVLATVIDGARHGIKINVIQDALGFRRQARHELALKRMEDFFDAYMVTTEEVLAREHFTVVEHVQETAKPKGGDSERAKDELEALVGNLSLDDQSSITATPSGDKLSTEENGQSSLIGTSDRRWQDNLAADDVKSGEDYATAIVRPRRTNGAEQPPANAGESNLVQSKPRMRKKNKKKKPTEESLIEPTGLDIDSAQTLRNGAVEPDAAAGEASEEPQPVATSDGQGGIVEKSADTAFVPSVPKPTELIGSRKHGSIDNPSIKATQHGSTTESTTPEAQPSSASLAGSTSLTATSLDTSVIVDGSSPSSSQISITAKPSKLKSLANLPVLGPEDRIAEGDSRIVYDLIPPDFCHPSDLSKPLADTIFQQLYDEVKWQKMLHQQGEVPRLVCCQGKFGDDGSKPIYRHPADQTLPLLHFSPKVQYVRRQAEKLVGHPLNHVLIQLYRNGNDYISEHSDKTLDIAKGSSIVNVSFGAQRTMRLRTKRDSRANPENDQEPQRSTQRVPMPHNSLFVLGLRSNEKWLHGIMADKRLLVERSAFETAYAGARISLTFRHIATFLDARETVIWGQGATSKDARGAVDVVNGDAAEAERIIRAFGTENHSNVFSWEECYGEGFDVLHLHEPPEQTPLLFASKTALEAKQIQVALAEAKVNYTLIDTPDLGRDCGSEQKIMYRDSDAHSTEVRGITAILHYLDRYHSFCADRPVTAASYILLEQLVPVLDYSAPANDRSQQQNRTVVMHMLNEQLLNHGGPFIAGKRFGIADCVVWPLLDECVEKDEDLDESTWPELAEYYSTTWKKKACLKKLRTGLPTTKKV